jgi:DivIVA domain-containing protein
VSLTHACGVALRALRLRQTDSVTSTFPLARSGKPGYHADEVDAFLERARAAFSAASGSEGALSSDDIRHAAFRVVRAKGYSARHVDAALERLEEAFAGREREHAIAEQGAEAFDAEARATAQDIIDRLARPSGAKFRRVSFLTRGYHPADVDLFSARVSAYVENGQYLSVETVRTVAFRPRYRGYHEAQVDHLLDTVIRIMLAVR